MLGPAALNGGASALEGVAVYTAVFGVYGVLRVMRAVADRRDKVAQAQPKVDAAVA